MNNQTKESAKPEQRTSNATLTIEVSNPHGIVCFEDLMMELFREYETEKNAKNKAYSFILSCGHFDEYYKWSIANRGKKINHHAEAVQALASMRDEVIKEAVNL